MTATTTLPTGITPEMLAAVVAYQEKQKNDAKTAREAAARKRTEQFTDALPALVPALETVILTHDQETWHKRDPKTKQTTDVVSGIGFHASGVTTVTFPDGTAREVRVNVWIKANPNGGAIPPEVLDNAEN